MRTPRHSDERGIALAMAVFGIMVIGALVAGAFVAGRLEHRTSQNSLFAAQAFEAGEAGLSDMMTNWNTGTYNGMAAGDTLTLPTVMLDASTAYTGRVTRLNDNIFMVVSAGQKMNAGGGVMSQRLVGTFARLFLPVVQMNAAITVDGEMTIGGSAEATGMDWVPGGWGGCPAPADVAGIRTSADEINTNGANCNNLDCVDGSPQAVTNDATIDSTIFNNFGGITFDELAAMANFQISGVQNGLAPTLDAGGRCDTSNLLNWGEPWSATTFGACFNYFPILHAPGDVKLNGGRGQGTLLVEGDLELAGGVEFYGPVIVKGRVKSTGTGGHINGGIMAGQVDLDPSTFSGNSLAQFSSCAIMRALQAAATARPLGERAWTHVYSMY